MNTLKIMRIYTLCLLLSLIILSCNHSGNEKLTIYDIEIFKETPIWDLANAVNDEDVVKIKTLLKDTTLINYQEPAFGLTLLIRAVGTEKYKSAKQLLESGAKPNIISKTGTSALFEAISYPWNDSNANGDSEFVKLLLDYGANPNQTYCSPRINGQTDPIECGTSPLMHSISRGFEKTKLLVEFGADINYKTKLGTTASIFALMNKDVNSAYYLIKEKKARISDPYYYNSLTDDEIMEKNKPHYPVKLLLDWIYEIDSKEYVKKMEIVEEFQRQGINYSEAKEHIGDLVIRRIKNLHPYDWKEYLEKY